MDLDPFYMKDSDYLEERLKQLTPWERLLLTKRPIIAPDGYIPNSVVRRRLRFAKPASPPPPWQLKPVPDFDPRYLPDGWKAKKDINLNGSLNLKVKEDALDSSFRGRSRYDGSSKGASVVTPVPLKGLAGEQTKTRFDYQTGAFRSKTVNFHVDEDSDETSDVCDDDGQQTLDPTAQGPEENRVGQSTDHPVGESRESNEPTSDISSRTKKKRSRRDQKKRNRKVEVRLAKVETKEVSSSSRKLTREGLSLLQRIVKEKWFPPGVQPVLDLVTSELIKLLDSMDDSVFTSVCEYIVKIFQDLTAAVEHLNHIETLLNIQLKSPSTVISKKALVTLKQLGLSVRQDGVDNGLPPSGAADMLATQELRLDMGSNGLDLSGRENGKSLKDKTFMAELRKQGANSGSNRYSETKVTKGVVSTDGLSHSTFNVTHGIDVVIKDKVMGSNLPSDQAADLATDEMQGDQPDVQGEDTSQYNGSDWEQQPSLSDQSGQRSHNRGGRKKRKSTSRKPNFRKSSGRSRDIIQREGEENMEVTQGGSPRESENLGDYSGTDAGGAIETSGVVGGGDGLKTSNSQSLQDLQQTSEKDADKEDDLILKEDNSHIREHVVVLPTMSHLSEPFGSFRDSFDGLDTVRGNKSILFSDSGFTGVSREMTPSQALRSKSLDDLSVGKDYYMGVSSQAIKGSDSMIDRGIQSLSPINSLSNINTEHEVLTDPDWRGAAYNSKSEENHKTEDDNELNEGDEKPDDTTDLNLKNRGYPHQLTTSDGSHGGLVNLNHYSGNVGMVDMTDYTLLIPHDNYEEKADTFKKGERSRHVKSTSTLNDEVQADMVAQHPVSDQDWRYLDQHRHGSMSRRSTIPKLPSLDSNLRHELILTFWDGPAVMNTWDDPLIRTREKEGSRSSRAFTTSMTRINPRQQSGHCEHYKWATKKMHHYISSTRDLHTLAGLGNKPLASFYNDNFVLYFISCFVLIVELKFIL